MLNGGATQRETTKNPDHIEYAVCAWHLVVTIASICLVCLMFAGDAHHQTDAYVMGPSGGCMQWGNGECIVQESAGNTAKLWGMLHMEERRAVGLFSSTNPAIVCLSAQIIAACITAAYAPLQSETSRLSMRCIAFVVLCSYAVAILFLQNRWQIPGNNLIWLEITLVGAIASFAADPMTLSSDLPRIIGSVFSVPMLCIAGLVAAGEANVVSLRISYVGILGVGVLWLIERISDAEEADRWHAAERSWALWFTPWLCVIPFATVASLRLQTMAVITDQQAWSIAELSVVVSWIFLIMVYFTACGISHILMQENETSEDEVKCALKTDFIGWTFYAMHQLLHSTVVLLILIGLYLNANA